MKRQLPFIIIGGVLVALLVVGTILFRSNSSNTQTIALPQPSPAASDSPGANQSTTTPLAAPKAVVTIEEFGDYQCPPCGSVHPILQSVKREFGEKVRLVFYQLPLTQVHKNALAAAHAAIAAKQQNHFWEMHDKLYENQQVWSEFEDIHPLALAYAREMKLDVEQFKRDMDSRQVAGLVQADMQRAESLGITSTPTLLVEGQPFPNDKLSVENLRIVINRFLTGQP